MSPVDSSQPDAQQQKPTTLDSLLSPVEEANFRSSVRDSVLDSDLQELALDDEARFTTVPLSAPPETPPPLPNGVTTHPPVPPPPGQTPSLHSIAIGQTVSTADDVPDSPQKVSISPRNSISNDGNVDFLLARLDSQKEHRASIEGTQKLREDFVRLQNDTVVEESPEALIDWDFWGAVVNDYEHVARTQPKRLARAIELGVPPALRGMIWQLMSASKDYELERTYAQLLAGTSPHEKAIKRDLGRTFPHHAFFTDGHGIGQESLFNVLKAYSLFDPECGYCQGLPFIVAPLLLVAPDEEAFCLLVRIMHSYDLRGQFLPEMPGLQLRLYQFDRLIEELLPALHLHFLRQGVKSSMFCSQWFLTLFAYRFPLDFVFRIFDHILATGIEAIFGFSVILLQKNEENLLKLKFDQILDYLKVSLLDCYKIAGESGSEDKWRVDDFVADVGNLRITPFQLDSFASEYAELKRAQNAHLVEMDNLRNQNRALVAQVKSLEEALAAMNREHVELVKEFVMSKVAKEELETELVKYKLLYAELMHQNEDALSSHRLSMAPSMSHRGSSL